MPVSSVALMSKIGDSMVGVEVVMYSGWALVNQLRVMILNERLLDQGQGQRFILRSLLD
jgi:hypothetical protein